MIQNPTNEIQCAGFFIIGIVAVNGLSAGFATTGMGAENGFAVSVRALIGLLTVADNDAVNGLGSGDGFGCDSP
jgi:hypothetical protein